MTLDAMLAQQIVVREWLADRLLVAMIRTLAAEAGAAHVGAEAELVGIAWQLGQQVHYVEWLERKLAARDGLRYLVWEVS